MNGHSLSLVNGYSLMSPRTRRLTDNHIADLACQLLVERGAMAVTFAEVSKRCGLAPPTLVQRFGSREGMVAAAAEALRARISQVFETSGQEISALESLLASLQRLAPVQAAALHIASAVSQTAYSKELRKQISFALVSAIGAGELPHCDVAQLARSIQLSFAGAVVIALLEGREAASEVASAVQLQLASYV
jgi:AcrR family transcriptional regulator